MVGPSVIVELGCGNGAKSMVFFVPVSGSTAM